MNNAFTRKKLTRKQTRLSYRLFNLRMDMMSAMIEKGNYNYWLSN